MTTVVTWLATTLLIIVLLVAFIRPLRRELGELADDWDLRRELLAAIKTLRRKRRNTRMRARQALRAQAH